MEMNRQPFLISGTTDDLISIDDVSSFRPNPQVQSFIGNATKDQAYVAPD